MLFYQDEDGHLLDEDSLIDEVQTFFFAGHDTTSSGRYSIKLANPIKQNKFVPGHL